MSESAAASRDLLKSPVLSINNNQLVVSGCLDVDNVGSLRNQGIALLEGLQRESPEVAVVIDLAGIEAHGSAAIALLIAWQRHLVRQKRSATFINAPAELKVIAAACGVAEILALT